MSVPTFDRDDQDPGVPEALPRTLRLLGERVGVHALDRVWVFPPLIRGRREWGLVAAGCFAGDPAVRRLVTARYHAELSGTGLRFEPEIGEEGEAPSERLPRVMEGVVRRSKLSLGDPGLVEVGGEAAPFESLLATLEPPEGMRSEDLVLNTRENRAS